MEDKMKNPGAAATASRGKEDELHNAYCQPDHTPTDASAKLTDKKWFRKNPERVYRLKRVGVDWDIIKRVGKGFRIHRYFPDNGIDPTEFDNDEQLGKFFRLVGYGSRRTGGGL